ncbi:Clp protease ClpP [candidate division KSB3 bacterium]|uniref:Clp protease ClpP n=1 Tax=candidate division KSB3 bacterium TaxID=2044937 RepID=A0A2G6KEI1_9BACT|nr:MAG: Clp protease ClpP [candidate division KSB3 bacterium]
MFGKVFFALISFFVLLFLFSLFFMALGLGIGGGIGQGSLVEVAEPDRLEYSYISGNQMSENKLLSIPIQGIILGSMPPNIPPAALLGGGVTYGYAVQEVLEKAAGDESIKGILLHMQSPGGTIFGSYAIFEGLKMYKEATGKPILAYIEGLAASGGVMAMVGADAIYADYGSLIGSIGVLGPQFMYYDKPVAIDGGLLNSGIVTEGGIEYTILHAGPGKDLGNPFRRMSDEERQNWQVGLENEYAQFVQHVADNRNIEETVIREQMGAQLFDNQRAQEFGLIDGTFNRNASLSELASLAGVSEDFQLVRPKRDSSHFFMQLLQGWSRIFSQAKSLHDMHQALIQQDICQATAHVPLVYYGDVTAVCR